MHRAGECLGQQSRGFRKGLPDSRKTHNQGGSFVLRGTRTPPTLSGSLRGGPNGHAPGRAVGLLQRTLQSHLTHTQARVGESHLQHPLLAITGWALPAARGALTAGNGLESNTPPDDATHVWVSSGGTSVGCCYCRPGGLFIARYCTHAAGATAAIALAMAATAGSCRDTHGPLNSGLDFY